MNLFEYIQFKNGNDNDYPSKNLFYLTFDTNEKYIIKGKTHNLTSHGIKHLIEYDYDFYVDLFNKFKQILIKSNDKIFLFKKNNKLIKTLKKEDINNINIKTFINTLDRINDKIQLNDKLISSENFIYNTIINKIKNKYEKIINNMISNSIYIKNKYSKKYILNMIKQKRILKFDIKSSGTNMILYINFKDSSIIIEHKNKIKSLYKLIKHGTPTTKEILNKLYLKQNKNKIINKHMIDILKEI